MKKDNVAELKRRIKELENLVKATEIISSSLSLEQVLDMIMEIGMDMINAQGCSILLKDEGKNGLRFVSVSGKRKEELKGMSLKLGEGVAGWVAKTGESVLISDASKDSRFSALVDKKLNQKTTSLMCVPLEIKGKIIGVTEVINKKDKSRFDDGDLSHFKALAGQSALAIERARLYQDLEDLFLATIRTLASAIDAKDPYTQGHSERVTKYSVVIAKGMGLDRETVRHVQLSAMLHDIGKIGIPEEILRKKEKLTEEDWGYIHKHPVIGADMLAPIKQLKEIIPGVRHHHERYDGTGYPDGLKGDKSPLSARIVGVADTFDAMTSSRPYRDALSDEASLSEVKRCSGRQFDPECAKAFLSAYKKGLIVK